MSSSGIHLDRSTSHMVTRVVVLVAATLFFSPTLGKPAYAEEAELSVVESVQQEEAQAFVSIDEEADVSEAELSASSDDNLAESTAATVEDIAELPSDIADENYGAGGASYPDADVNESLPVAQTEDQAEPEAVPEAATETVPEVESGPDSELALGLEQDSASGEVLPEGSAGSEVAEVGNSAAAVLTDDRASYEALKAKYLTKSESFRDILEGADRAPYMDYYQDLLADDEFMRGYLTWRVTGQLDFGSVLEGLLVADYLGEQAYYKAALLDIIYASIEKDDTFEAVDSALNVGKTIKGNGLGIASKMLKFFGKEISKEDVENLAALKDLDVKNLTPDQRKELKKEVGENLAETLGAWSGTALDVLDKVSDAQEYLEYVYQLYAARYYTSNLSSALNEVALYCPDDDAADKALNKSLHDLAEVLGDGLESGDFITDDMFGYGEKYIVGKIVDETWTAVFNKVLDELGVGWSSIVYQMGMAVQNAWLSTDKMYESFWRMQALQRIDLASRSAYENTLSYYDFSQDEHTCSLLTGLADIRMGVRLLGYEYAAQDVEVIDSNYLSSLLRDANGIPQTSSEAERLRSEGANLKEHYRLADLIVKEVSLKGGDGYVDFVKGTNLNLTNLYAWGDAYEDVSKTLGEKSQLTAVVDSASGRSEKPLVVGNLRVNGELGMGIGQTLIVEGDLECDYVWMSGPEDDAEVAPLLRVEGNTTQLDHNGYWNGFVRGKGRIELLGNFTSATGIVADYNLKGGTIDGVYTPYLDPREDPEGGCLAFVGTGEQVLTSLHNTGRLYLGRTEFKNPNVRVAEGTTLDAILVSDGVLGEGSYNFTELFLNGHTLTLPGTIVASSGYYVVGNKVPYRFGILGGTLVAGEIKANSIGQEGYETNVHILGDVSRSLYIYPGTVMVIDGNLTAPNLGLKANSSLNVSGDVDAELMAYEAGATLTVGGNLSAHNLMMGDGSSLHLVNDLHYGTFTLGENALLRIDGSMIGDLDAMVNQYGEHVIQTIVTDKTAGGSRIELSGDLVARSDMSGTTSTVGLSKSKNGVLAFVGTGTQRISVYDPSITTLALGLLEVDNPLLEVVDGLTVHYIPCGIPLELFEVNPVEVAAIKPGEPARPEFSLTYLGRKFDYTGSDTSRFTVTFQDNDKPGTAYAIVTGRGPLTGTITIPFEARYSLPDYATGVIPYAVQEYTDYTNIDEVVTLIGEDGNEGPVLVKGRDYYLDMSSYYSTYVHEGRNYLNLKGMGDYTGRLEVWFDVVGYEEEDTNNLENLYAYVESNPVIFTGSPCTPKVIVDSYEGLPLDETDYEVEYGDNDAIGTAWVRVTGVGSYYGSKLLNFEIVEKSSVQLIDQTILVSDAKLTYGATKSLGAQSDGDGLLTYTSSDPKVVTVSSEGVVTARKAGKATITVHASATEAYGEASKTVTVTVNKAANTLKVARKATKVKVLAKTVKTKAVVLASNIRILKKGKEKLRFTNASSNKTAKKFVVNKQNGKLTVRKGTKKGTYTVKICVNAAGDTNHKPAKRYITFRVVVK